MDSIPIIVVSGFLGSGKTTLIKRIIDLNPEYRFGLVQNEFSQEMGIEKPLFVDSDATIYELPSGCLCCSAKSELTVAIDSLIRIKSDLNYVLIEASGVANVIELINMLWVDRNSDCRFHLSSAVALVDGLNFVNTISGDDAMSRIATTQISSVSNIIITKTTSCHEVEGRIRRINLNCEIYYFDRLNFREIIHWNDFVKQPTTNAIKSLSEHLDQSMTKFIQISVAETEVLSLDKLNNTIAMMLWNDSNNDNDCIYRCKGIFRAYNDSETLDDEHLSQEWIYTLQGVGSTYEILAVHSGVYEKINPVENKFIFITNFSKNNINEKLQNCIINKIY